MIPYKRKSEIMNIFSISGKKFFTISQRKTHTSRSCEAVLLRQTTLNLLNPLHMSLGMAQNRQKDISGKNEFSWKYYKNFFTFNFNFYFHFKPFSDFSNSTPGPSHLSALALTLISSCSFLALQYRMGRAEASIVNVQPSRASTHY